MLEFIVLGIVPGTTIQLSFQQIAAVTTIFLGVVILLHEHRAGRAARLAFERQSVQNTTL